MILKVNAAIVPVQCSLLNVHCSLFNYAQINIREGGFENIRSLKPCLTSQLKTHTINQGFDQISTKRINIKSGRSRKSPLDRHTKHKKKYLYFRMCDSGCGSDGMGGAGQEYLAQHHSPGNNLLMVSPSWSSWPSSWTTSWQSWPWSGWGWPQSGECNEGSSNFSTFMSCPLPPMSELTNRWWCWRC